MGEENNRTGPSCKQLIVHNLEYFLMIIFLREYSGREFLSHKKHVYPFALMVLGNKVDIIRTVGLDTMRIPNAGISKPPIPRVLRILVDLSFADYFSMCDLIFWVDSFVLGKQVVA